VKSSFYFAVFMLLLIVIFSVITPYVYPISFETINKDLILSSPSFLHPFGTDRLGRDLFALCAKGTQTSLIVGFLSSFIATLIGLIVGITAGFFRGGTDKSIIVIIDMFLTFPTFFLLLALISYINASIITLVFVIFITGWMSTARLARSESFKISYQPFIRILKLANVSKTKIVFKYFSPLLAPIFFISLSFGVSGAILAESGLSFLGLGVTSPGVSLGLIISEGKSFIKSAWWISFFAGFIILLITFSLISISDYLQSIFNQKEKNEFKNNS
jgi:peptide/nickel transport system permease protein